MKAVEEHRPDLLLLDVQMPKLNGFEVLELLSFRPRVIFITAYDEYALKAFEVDAVDYLLKPFPAERLGQALERARERIAGGQEQTLDGLVGRAGAEREAPARLLVREGARIHVLAAEQIDYVESQDDYVVIRAGELRLRKKQTLGEVEARLSRAGFVRIHRCYLLNLERLDRLESYAKDSRVAFLADGTRLPVSRSGYARLRELL